MKPKPLQILVADDEKDIRELVRHWLVGSGHEVKAVPSGKDACQQLKKQKFDLVVTDVLMSDGDGLELIEELKKTQPGTPILAISGGGRYIAGDNCLKIARGFGAHGALMKPFTREQLLAAVAQTLVPPAKEGW